MIIAIHFNVFHVTCLLPKKIETAFVRQKLSHGRHHLSPKNTECLYVRQEQVAAQNTKTMFLGDMSCRPYKKFCCLKKKKLNSGNISSSHVRQ